MMSIFFLFIFLSMESLAASSSSDRKDERRYSYLYPVGTIEYDDTDFELVLWQTQDNTTELYVWDAKTNCAYKELFSLFTPVGIQVLPSKKAYSFIDSGRVRIKELIKRSPATLVFDKPIYNISQIHWLNDMYAYCHAQEGHRFGLYVFNRGGDVKRILYDLSGDYLFPSYVDNHLFYVSRRYVNNKSYYAVRAVSFDAHISDTFFSYSSGDRSDKLVYDTTTLYTAQDQELIIQSGEMPLAFLYMESKDRGFVLVHQREIGESQNTIPFHYYMIEKKEGKWGARQLFTFGVPAFLLDAENENRLYENVLPLLPYHDGDKIYYGSAHIDAQTMQLYCFNRTKNNKRRCRIVSHGANRSPLLFCPRRCNGGLLCGGSLMPDMQQFIPTVYVEEGGDLVFKFVKYK